MVLIPVLAVLALAPNTSANNNDGVEQMFERFRTSVMARDGRATADTVSRATIAVYENCRKLAISAKESELERLTQAEVLVVLRMRFAMERQALEKMDGRSLFEHSIDNGWTSDSSALEKMRLGKIRIEGDKAFATVVMEEKDVPGLEFDFVREKGQWRFDVTAFHTRAEPMFAQLRRSENKTKVQLAMMFLERVYGEQMPKEILAGPLE